MSIEVQALPSPFVFEPRHTALVIIDMQRDFIEPGGFGESLGNDVSLLARIVPTVVELLALARKSGLLVVHTRESHAPDLSDCPPAKRLRGAPQMRIGDPGPMGRILVRGEPGNAIVDALAPLDGELVIDKPGKGAFYATPLSSELNARSITHLLFAGVTTEVCVQTSMREANDRGYECLLDRRCDRQLLSGVHAGEPRNDSLAGRHRRLDRAARGIERGTVRMEVNKPEIVAEVSAAFVEYERALVDNDVEAMNALFWHTPETVRYGIAEVQHGGEAIRAWRASCAPVPPSRRLHRTVVTTFGNDYATVSTEFTSDATLLLGRQMQTWARLEPAARAHQGWKIVAAHVSLIVMP
jgi:nicotinamidase-related amidase